jgi:Ras-related protein Rab-11A
MSLTSAYYRGALGALLVYDVTNAKSFDNVKLWIRELKTYATNDIVIMLVGNKVDLVDNREVRMEEAAGYAEENHLAFMETSAFTGHNVEIAFERVVNGKFFILVITSEIYRVMKTAKEQAD